MYLHKSPDLTLFILYVKSQDSRLRATALYLSLCKWYRRSHLTLDGRVKKRRASCLPRSQTLADGHQSKKGLADGEFRGTPCHARWTCSAFRVSRNQEQQHSVELHYPGLITHYYDERLGMFSKAARAQANGKVSSDHCKTQCF